MAALEKNCFEHISLMAQEQVEVEFRGEMQQIMAIRQNPQAAMNPQIQMQLKMTAEKIEARKAQLIADMMEEFMKEEKKITSQFDSDPLLKLKAREVDLRAMENERKKEADQAKVENDRAKLMQAADIADEKLDQNEKLAKLRAGVSLAKAGNPGITAIEVED